MRERGAIYVAYGEQARAMLPEGSCIYAPGLELPFIVVSEDILPEPALATPGRMAKTLLPELTPFKNTVYLDVDTEVKSSDILTGFNLLDMGWELVICPSQQDEWLGHLKPESREHVFESLRWRPLQLQGGVFWFRNTAQIHRLFDHWQSYWAELGRGEDQGALLMALQACPVKTWLLGPAFNGGEVIAHNFGALR